MLTLTRKADESVVIADVIKLRVVEVRGDRVRLGFIAPPDVKIWRSEIYERAIANQRGILIDATNGSRRYEHTENSIARCDAVSPAFVGISLCDLIAGEATQLFCHSAERRLR